MFGTRRLAKRSIVGSRVCALSTDGRYNPGVIESIQVWPNGEEVYTVNFSGGSRLTVQHRDIVGPGFQTVTSVNLKPGQKVYITHHGREVPGAIVRTFVGPDADDDTRVCVKIAATSGSSDGDDVIVTRRLDDIRLMASRKSARLQDHDTDYSRLADLHPETKKRPVSHVIDVPAPAAKFSRSRKDHASPVLDGLGSGSPREEFEAGIMDEHMAALVLTSLSCSPASPTFPPSMLEKGACSSPMAGSSVGSSGVWGMKSESSTPSPPEQSHSAPVSIVFGSSIDEGIEMDESRLYFSDDWKTKDQSPVSPVKTVYQCTWPGCSKIYNTCPGIEKHVRTEHLTVSEDNDSDTSDHEEEFYYTEIEVTVDTMTQSFADMYTSSPPQKNRVVGVSEALPDHDYQKKKEVKPSPQNIPQGHVATSSYPQASSCPMTIPVNIPQLSQSLSWHVPQQVSPPVRMSKANDRLQQHQAQSPKTHFLSSSPKNSPMHKKCRSEVKKCRKVYGMENRELWCTQCKWKKACSRFLD